jgi:hypothetical protein
VSTPRFLGNADFDLVVGGDDCGLLVGRKSGQILTLNRSATTVWQRHLEGSDTEHIVSWIHEQVDMSPRDARKVVEETLSPKTESVQQADKEYRYEPDGAGFRMSSEGQDRLWYSNDGNRVRWMDDERSHQRIGDCLWTALPRLLFLKGQYLVHGSAICHRGQATLFIGDNGAGKSSTARAFASNTTSVCGDDKIAIGVDPSGGTVAPDAEPFFRRWLADARSKMESSENPIGGPERYAGAGVELPVTGVFFLSPAQREHSTVFRFEPMGETEAAGLLFRQFFFGNNAHTQWQAPLHWSAYVANQARCGRLYVPNDLETLKRGAENFLEREHSLVTG